MGFRGPKTHGDRPQKQVCVTRVRVLVVHVLEIKPQRRVQRAHRCHAGHPAEILRVDRGGHTRVIRVVENVIGIDAEPSAYAFLARESEEAPQ